MFAKVREYLSAISAIAREYRSEWYQKNITSQKPRHLWMVHEILARRQFLSELLINSLDPTGQFNTHTPAPDAFLDMGGATLIGGNTEG